MRTDLSSADLCRLETVFLVSSIRSHITHGRLKETKNARDRTWSTQEDRRKPRTSQSSMTLSQQHEEKAWSSHRRPRQRLLGPHHIHGAPTRYEHEAETTMQTETYMLKSRITELNLANAAEHRSIYQSRQNLFDTLDSNTAQCYFCRVTEPREIVIRSLGGCLKQVGDAVEVLGSCPYLGAALNHTSTKSS